MTTKVLYVDDDEFIREVAEMSLALNPEFEVRTVGSGPAALAVASAGDWVPDLFLLDVMMPQMDGPTLLQRLRELPQHATTPAAFVTARAQPHERAALIAAGAVGVLVKPFDPIGLPGEVQALLAA